MDLEIIMLSEISQQRKTYHMISLIHRIIKMIQNNIYKTETNSQISKSNLWLPKEKTCGGGINWGDGIGIYTTMYRIDNWQEPAV